MANLRAFAAFLSQKIPRATTILLTAPPEPSTTTIMRTAMTTVDNNNNNTMTAAATGGLNPHMARAMPELEMTTATEGTTGAEEGATTIRVGTRDDIPAAGVTTLVLVNLTDLDRRQSQC